ncbi:MAG TPA: M23 family metallopeptidase [Anaerolineales bacterium]|nr:M23 family metallopeptidase [Anaerolineales bacterium]
MDKRWLLAVILLGILAGAGYYLYRNVYFPRTRTFWRSARLGEWLGHPDAHPDWMIHAGTRCGDAPFVMPTDGYIGFLWGDSFQIGKLHQGLDIFGGTGIGKTPVVAAYPGYLTRLPTWKSAVILRIPEDPLQPGRQIWLYYTHMADPNGDSFISSAFPPGTSEKYVEAGTLLGYQGDYTGDPDSPTGVHLHFSVDMDDGRGGFRNELDIRNTLDPSPYLGLPVNAATNGNVTPVCNP